MNNKLLEKLLPWIAVGLCAIYLLAPLLLPQPSAEFNRQQFGELPVSFGGRFKPIDTVARNSLTIISGRESFKIGDQRVTAIEWLLDVMSRPELSNEYRVFLIDNFEVRDVLGLDSSSDEKRFAFSAIRANVDEFQRQALAANNKPAAQRTPYDKNVMKLWQHLSLYMSLANLQRVHPVPPPDGDGDWLTLPDALTRSQQSGSRPEVVTAYLTILQAYQEQKAPTFNREVAALHARLAADFASLTDKASAETQFNSYAPFYRCMLLYVVAALVTLVAWVGWRAPLLTAANRMLILIFIVHTIGLIVRVYLSGRPPVTNLYSSAVFIGWGSVGMCLLLERLHRNGMGIITATTTGALTLLIARNLSSDGDTMAVLQAVLDTNFWLATHVVVITLGYSATFLAGFLGILFVLRGLLTPSLGKEDARRMGQMIYGIICFATLFSFVGTILGGIWADQSWGRFWGWDPKENGALMIVIWNALILHARWGGMIQQRGMAVLAIFGNIVTSWSWFGVNMLGAGLHSYGFMESALFWLLMFVASQLVLIAVGCLPTSYWRSFQASSVTPSSSS